MLTRPPSGNETSLALHVTGSISAGFPGLGVHEQTFFKGVIHDVFLQMQNLG